MLDTLVSLGLTRLDAQVYVFLTKKGPQAENYLASAMKITEQQLHLSLKNLHEKGFITSKTENQTVFSAVPLEKVIDNIVKAKTEETQRIQQYRESLLSNPNP